MFARAAIVGRVARERSEARRHFYERKQNNKKKTPQAPLKRRCFIPIIRRPCMAVACGSFLIVIGMIMCNFAFHATEYSSTSIERLELNTTVTEMKLNKTKRNALKSLTFVGPSLMGLGIFIIIIACVLLLDERDKILKRYTDNETKNQQELSMELSLHAAVNLGIRTSSAKGRHYRRHKDLYETKSAGTPSKVGYAKTLNSAISLQELPSQMRDENKEVCDENMIALLDLKGRHSHNICSNEADNQNDMLMSEKTVC